MINEITFKSSSSDDVKYASNKFVVENFSFSGNMRSQITETKGSLTNEIRGMGSMGVNISIRFVDKTAQDRNSQFFNRETAMSLYENIKSSKKITGLNLNFEDMAEKNQEIMIDGLEFLMSILEQKKGPVSMQIVNANLSNDNHDFFVLNISCVLNKNNFGGD